MSHNLGAIESDVEFNFTHAESLKTAFTNAARTLEDQADSRASLVSTAQEDFKGYFSTLFDTNSKTAAADASDLTIALTNAADLVNQLIDQAREENERRRIAREFVAEQEAESALKKGIDEIFGDQDPPVGPASDPMSKSTQAPANTPRQNPAPDSGGGPSGGTSSAIPENLRAFSSGLEPLETTVKNKHSTLETAYSDFQGSCNYGSLNAADLMTALGKWLEANEQDIAWAKTIAQAFEDAGATSGHPVALANSALATSLQNAGVAVAREDLTIMDPTAVGGPPTTGYTLDPVNTANGNFIEPETDLGFTGGCASLALKRMYNSRGQTGGVFGPGWSSTLDMALRFTDEGATWVMADGRALPFARAGEGFAPCAEENFWLLPVNQVSPVQLPAPQAGSVVWVITDNAGGRWFFDATGTWVGSCPAGEGSAYYPTYSSDGTVATVHHERGRFISFEYVDGLVAVATASDGRRIEYTYSAAGLLTGAQGASYRRVYTHNEQGLIEVVADAAGVQEVINTYDPYGRVLTQKTPHGRLVRFSYLPGRVTVVADENGQRSNSWVSDARGRLIGVIDAHDQRQSMAYDQHGNLVSVTERDGSVTVHAYDDRGRRVRTVTGEGADITYRWDELDRLVDMVTAHGGLITYTYEGSSRHPSQIRDALGGVTELTWEAGLLRQVTGPTGVRLSFDYTATGDLRAVTNAFGETSSLTYDAAGRAVAARTPSGDITQFAYDEAGHLISRTDPDGAVHRFEYDGAGRLVALVDPTGARTQMRYGAHGEVVETIDPLGRSVSRVFDDAGNVASAVLPDGSAWGFEHDALSRLVAVTDPAGGIWSREYDVTGQLAATVDPLGNRVTATVNRKDQRITLSDVFGSASIQTDMYGRPVKREGLDGSAELISYDAAGNPVELVDGEGALTRYEYDAAGKLVALIFPDDSRIEYGYDAAGRPETLRDAAGGVTRLVYDADSRVVGKVGPTGEESTYEYDACGRLVLAREPGRGIARYGYDACGRVVFAQDGAMGTRRFAYDAAGQLVQAINGLGGRTHYEYDVRGRLVRITDPAGAVTRRTYTQLNQVDSVTDALGRVTRATYDAAGRQLRQTDPSGSTSTWTYDAAGRETSLSVDGRLVSSVERDLGGRSVRIRDFSCGEQVDHELVYDRVGRLLSRSRGDQSTRWSYDAAGKVLSRTDAVGGTVSYAYDAAGRLVRASDSAGGQVEYVYDGASRIISASTAELVSSWVYTEGAVSGHVLTDAGGQTLAQSVISRDEWGRVVSVQKQGTGAELSSVAYGYDEASQLVSVTGGHRQVAARYEYDVCGRLTRSVGADGVERVFAYDEASQLVSVTASSGEVTIFLYDGLGRRVRQEDADGAVREFAYGPTGYLSTVELGDGTEGEHTVHRIEVDALGEIVAVDGVALGWDVTAAVPVLVSVGEVSVGVGPVMSWRVARSMGEGDPYGVAGSGGVAGADVSGVGSGGVLAGFALSADGIPVVAGIELMGARGYDPVTASFLSVDPLVPVVGAAWGSNPYSFAGNNPVMMSDPWGLRPATDADLVAYREANQGALADAGDWVADNWEYVAAGAMVVAGVA
ncbi:DUF6531 domain-containing protein, partial [Rothia nasisuis]|uniref:DUF6531 domain-containing protein n=1 Tax=Rothia nasisuis TaxID=2109647 RepID=UPI001F2A9276